MKIHYTTLILIASDLKSNADKPQSDLLLEPNESLLILHVTTEKEEKLYSARGRTLSSVILKGLRFQELSELARKTILNATSTFRTLGNEVSVIELDSYGRFLAITMLPKLDIEKLKL